MARTLGQAFIEIRGDASKLGSDLKSGLQRPAEEAGRDAGKRIADNVNKSVSGISFGSVVKQAAGFAAILGAGGIVGQAAKMGITTAAALQQAQVGFTTLIGSGTKAQDFLKQLSSFAAATPFELHGLVDSSRLLLGVGVDAQQVIPMLTAFGDAAGAVGVGQEAFQRIMLATSQAISAGKFQAQDLNQITENGIPIWKLMSEATGKPVPELRKLSSEGKLLSSDILPKLQAQMEKDYGGSMAKQSQTLAGVWSTLQDTVSIGLANALQPLVPMLSQLLPRAADVAGHSLALLSTWFANTVTRVRDLVGWMRQHQTLVVSVASVVGALAAMVGVYSVAVKTAALVTQGWQTAVSVYRGAAFLAIAATQGWTAAQEALDGALIANPIGLVVLAIAALVGGLILAYQHSATFRAIVQGALRAVGEAGRWMWDTVLKPAFTALVAFWQGTVIPVALQLWHGVLEPAFRGIAQVATWLWENILKPSFMAWKLYISDYLIPILLALWRNVVVPVFQGIRLAVEVAWVAIRIIFGLIEAYVKFVLAPMFMWFWHNIIEPSWKAFAGNIQIAWSIVHPIFIAIGEILKNDVAPKFRQGVQMISDAWATVREAAAGPVRFLVNTVIDKGIIGAWNWIHDHLKVGSHIDTISPGFAEGGRIAGPGTGTSDSIWAQIPGGPFLRVSNGEYIVRAAAVDQLGVPFLDYVNSFGGPRRATYPGDGSAGIAFAGGGFLGALSDVWSVLTDPIKTIAAPIRAAIGQIPGAGPFRDMVAGIGSAAVNNLVGAVNGLFTSAGSVAGSVVGPAGIATARAFLLSQVGKPYGWAMAGPGSYDCSGIVSAVYNVLHGHSPYSHTFSTQNEAPFFPLSGAGGALTAAWTNPGEAGVGGGPGGVGHTMGILAGILPFESVGGVGVRVGANVTSPGRFAHLGHFARGGLLDIPTISMDSGIGVLQPGANIVLNGTGAREPINAAAGTVRLDEYSIGRLAQALLARPTIVGITGPNDLGLAIAGMPT